MPRVTTQLVTRRSPSRPYLPHDLYVPPTPHQTTDLVRVLPEARSRLKRELLASSPQNLSCRHNIPHRAIPEQRIISSPGCGFQRTRKQTHIHFIPGRRHTRLHDPAPQQAITQELSTPPDCPMDIYSVRGTITKPKHPALLAAGVVG